jgi:hypothetical protein
MLACLFSRLGAAQAQVKSNQVFEWTGGVSSLHTTVFLNLLAMSFQPIFPSFPFYFLFLHESLCVMKQT